MFNKFKISEVILLALVVVIIFVSEYYFIVLNNPLRAIFIGLWPPTILGLLIYVNVKKNR